MKKYLHIFIFTGLLLFVVVVFSETTQFSLADLKNETILNPHEFKFIRNPEYSICQSSKNRTDAKNTIDILFYVHTASSHFRSRIQIRETWARRSLFPRTRLVFMIGYKNDTAINAKLDLEASLYNDIVQEDFFDTYRNITYKCMMALKWITLYCPQVNIYTVCYKNLSALTFFIFFSHLSTNIFLSRFDIFMKLIDIFLGFL